MTIRCTVAATSRVWLALVATLLLCHHVVLSAHQSQNSLSPPSVREDELVSEGDVFARGAMDNAWDMSNEHTAIITASNAQQQQQQEQVKPSSLSFGFVELSSSIRRHEHQSHHDATIGPPGSASSALSSSSSSASASASVSSSGLPGSGVALGQSPSLPSAGDMTASTGIIDNNNKANVDGKTRTTDSSLAGVVVQEPNNILNSGTSRMHTDRDGHHYIYMVNNNVLTQAVPTASSQIMAAAAAQAIARQIVEMNHERQEVEKEGMQEESSKSKQVQQALAESKASAAAILSGSSSSSSSSSSSPSSSSSSSAAPKSSSSSSASSASASAKPSSSSSSSSPSQSSSASSQSASQSANPSSSTAAEIADAKKREADAKQRLIVTLADPWKNYGSEYGDVTATRIDKICVVSGMVAGSSGLVATLGPDCRPAGGRLVFALVRGDVISRVDVLSDGRIYVIAGGNDGWLSLSGITFVVGTDAQVELLSGWQDYGNGYRHTTISKISDLCVLSGLIRSGHWGKPFGRVPQECYPNQRLVFSLDNHEVVSRVDLVTSGHFVWAAGARSHGWLSLDGLMWCVADGGINLNLGSGWSNYGGEYRAARYCMVRSMCVVSGLVRNDEDWATKPIITVLPPPCRPKAREVFSVSVNINAARVDVFPNGNVVYQSGKMNWPWLSLEGIRFAVASLGATISDGDVAVTGAASPAGVQAAAAASAGVPGKAATTPSAKPAFRSLRFLQRRRSPPSSLPYNPDNDVNVDDAEQSL